MKVFIVITGIIIAVNAVTDEKLWQDFKVSVFIFFLKLYFHIFSKIRIFITLIYECIHNSDIPDFYNGFGPDFISLTYKFLLVYF